MFFIHKAHKRFRGHRKRQHHHIVLCFQMVRETLEAGESNEISLGHYTNNSKNVWNPIQTNLEQCCRLESPRYGTPSTWDALDHHVQLEDRPANSASLVNPTSFASLSVASLPNGAIWRKKMIETHKQDHLLVLQNRNQSKEQRMEDQKSLQRTPLSFASSAALKGQKGQLEGQIWKQCYWCYDIFSTKNSRLKISRWQKNLLGAVASAIYSCCHAGFAKAKDSHSRSRGLGIGATSHICSWLKKVPRPPQEGLWHPKDLLKISFCEALWTLKQNS